MAEAKLKPGGIILIIAFAVAIVGFGWYATQQANTTGADGGAAATSGQGGGASGGQSGGQQAGGQQSGGEGTLQGTLETTYEEVGREGPPSIQVPAGKYVWNEEDPTVVFPINIWAGWGPIIVANDGFAPGSPNSVFKKYGFKVELRLIDDPVKSAEAYASGQAHTLWGTLDMIALFAPQLQKVNLTPKVFQQVDWSQGGDGIVVRPGIQTVQDLRGKTIALCQNSPSHYYVLQLLSEVGLTSKDVNFRFTSTAFGASALFAQDRSVHACVSWAPDIYTLTDPEVNPGGHARLLSTTADAANVIADVWAARPDFARDHPEVIEGLVKGILEGVDRAREDPDRVAALMAAGYGFPVEECKGMLADAYSTGLGDNVRFFLSDASENKVNFVGTWNSAVKAYREYGAIEQPVAASAVMDSSVIKKISESGEFKHQNAQEKTFSPLQLDITNLEASPDEEVLRVPKQIQFKPNQWDLDPQYDENLNQVMEEVKELAQRYAGARIIIEGNVDTSKKNEIRRLGPRQFAIMAEAVQELSEKRANSVKERLVELLPEADPNRFAAFGNGWDNPLDPLDHSKNRRVDIRVIRVE